MLLFHNAVAHIALAQRSAAAPISIGTQFGHCRTRTPQLLLDSSDVDDDDDDDDDNLLAYRMWSSRTRWAPAMGSSRWDQRDTTAASVVKDLLSSNEPLELSAPLNVTLKRRLGEGRFGDVLLGETSDGGQVAVKVALRQAAHLAHEAAVLRALDGVEGFPKLLHYQRADGPISELLVMECLGLSLQTVWETSSQRATLSASKVLRIGQDVLQCLRHLHFAGYLHNDLKPSNILLGAPDSARATCAHLVDFGYATTIRPSEAHTQEPDGDEWAVPEQVRDRPQGVGSPAWASLAALEGRPLCPHDDVESLLYVLTFLASGALPWQSQPRDAIALAKRACASDFDLLADSLQEVCSSAVHRALQQLWSEVRRASSRSTMDYDACLGALQDGSACER